MPPTSAVRKFIVLEVRQGTGHGDRAAGKIKFSLLLLGGCKVAHIYNFFFSKHLERFKIMVLKCCFKPEKLYYDFSACVEAFLQSFTVGYKDAAAVTSQSYSPALWMLKTENVTEISFIFLL